MRMATIVGIAMAPWVALAWPGPLAAGAGDVEVKVFQFRPTPTPVAAGATVTWVNRDEIEHTVTSGTPDGPDGKFDTALADKGATATVRFTEPGIYPYFCRRHQAMRGEVRVQ